jgi:aspartyl-tRNA(Asn)/glutamyl-tRNA(Gln) amidotransferase subunit C
MEIKKIAELARLHLSLEEEKKFESQLKDILKYVEKLNEVDTKNVEPLVHPVSFSLRLRDDVVEYYTSPKEILECAPDTIYDNFKVPQVVKGKK